MKKEINYKVTGKEWEEAKDKAFTKLNAKHRIDGFRQGKAPRAMFEKKFPGEIVMEAANNLIDKKYREIIFDKNLKPVVEPKVNIVKLDDKELEVNFTVVSEPEVKLGKYKNLGVKKETIKVSKEEIDKKIDALLKDYAELVVKESGKVETGDVAVIDFEGFKDGVPFDGGKGENYSLEIGSNTFIPGFEDGVKGMKNGESKDIKLTFPKDYGMADLAGKEVIFKVKVNEIKNKVIPTLDKDFFLDLGMKDVTNKSELEAKIKEEIKLEKDRDAEGKYVDALLKAASSNMKCDIDDEIVDAEANAMYNNFLENMKMQGINEELYLQYANTTKEDIINNMKSEALRRIENSYLLQAVIKEEKIKVTDKEVNKEIDDMAKKYNMTTEDVVKNLGGMEAMKYDLEVRKAIEIMKGE